ncbi:ABC-2 type transporter [Venturia nashicola]|nr:ABC-2 type transporter [Venturia nashicola]
MAYAGTHGDGIIRTASGRETYAPDGLGTPAKEYEEEKATSDEASRATSERYAPITGHIHRRNSSDTERGSDEDMAMATRSKSFAEHMDTDDKDELNRILTSLSQHKSRSRSSLQRKDTITGLNADDPILDPGNKDFDLYRYLRLFMRDLQADGRDTKKAGIVFKNLSVSGSGAALQLQSTVSDFVLAPFRVRELFRSKKTHKQIIDKFDGVLKSGELLIVLGRPGSGCSTFLKTLCGELTGLNVDKGSTIHYNGIPQKKMIKEFKGEVVYNQEVDKHFPHLTVGQTLEFATAVRTPSNRLRGESRAEFSKKIAKVVMAVFGLSHTYNTKVGNDFVRGVSGGERKRVSIAEMAVAGAPLAAWDNSTRGLDSATALKFVESTRISADLTGSAHAIAIYQASQAIYELFDKAVVLYSGRQIYYGPASKAKQFFEEQGWYCPKRQTTGDFLTSITNPSERKPRGGMEKQVPRTPEDFENYWKNSEMYRSLQKEIEDHETEFPMGGETLDKLQQQKENAQAAHTRRKSPYMISVPMQVKLCTKRAYQRTWNDLASTLTMFISQIIMALIFGSVFYGTPNATTGFFSKGAVLFFAVLLNALIAMSEINSLYDQRPIVEKHNSYAFYHPSTEAIAGIVSDIPVKFLLAVGFNVILYFLAGLRREPSQFFLYFLINYLIMFVMAAVFRTMAAITKTISQAMTLGGILVLALIIYTGFVIPVSYMKPWFGWIHYINPIYYAFEILIANEFHGREFTCSAIIPAYTPLQGDSWICSIVGAVPGRRTVSGDAFIMQQYQYSYSHVWRNFGILIGFLIGFMTIYFVGVEVNSSTGSAAEFLIFRRGYVPSYMQDDPKHAGNDEEKMAEGTTDAKDDGGDVNVIPPQKDIFTWKDVVYDIQIKGEERRLLDHVTGWVRPGTLTALMGVSGAGKTTLLDVLAQRTTMGVVTGDMLVNGKPLDASFQRKTGYVQQQDLHLETATVRESLRFSALLRQPKNVTQKEKYDYVDDVIKMLNMEDFAEAIVGSPGEGLNVEQRKLLTIGVELAAKPKLLLFLDEPTSGLDSQSAWSICAFLRKLADAGQAVLCTIHQPSAILFQEFDRLLFLAKGGKTVYFGPVGENSQTLIDYYESNGARKCGEEENPAEYMLEIVNKGSSGQGQDWHEVWKGSKERQDIDEEMKQIHKEKEGETIAGANEEGAQNEFAMPFTTQVKAVTVRVFQQYWRMPSYIFAKWALGIASGLFISFSFFLANTTQQGVQNVLFSAFMIATIFSSLVQQIMPLFVNQRSLYEVREKPSKSYSWKAFMIANILVEIPYNIFLGVLVFACYLYAITGVIPSARQVLVLLLMIQFFVYSGTFAVMCIAALPDAETAAAIVTLLFAMSLTFNGVMQSPTALPGFWIFMYRVSPFTYWISSLVSTMLHGRRIECSSHETSTFSPPAGQTCRQYLAGFLRTAPGTLQNPDATTNCRYCSLSTADQFLAGTNVKYDTRWRDFGIVWAYVIFNIFVAVLTYYVFRVKKWKKGTGKSKPAKKAGFFGKFLKKGANKGNDAKTEKGEGIANQHQRAI